MILLNLKIIISLCSNFMLHGVGKSLFTKEFFVNFVVFSLSGSTIPGIWYRNFSIRDSIRIVQSGYYTFRA